MSTNWKHHCALTALLLGACSSELPDDQSAGTAEPSLVTDGGSELDSGASDTTSSDITRVAPNDTSDATDDAEERQADAAATDTSTPDDVTSASDVTTGTDATAESDGANGSETTTDGGSESDATPELDGQVAGDASEATDSAPGDNEVDGDVDDDAIPAVPTPCPAYGPPQVMGNLPPGITEASGMAVSEAQPGVLWVHNDSGDKARLYAIETSGERLATVTLDGTYAYDWEDMAAGPCAEGEANSGCLYVGDIGDNSRIRTYLKIHRVPEPDVTLGDHTITTDGYDTMTVVYPDEPHDCEALVVDSHGYIYLLTKEWSNAVFRLYGSPYIPGAIEVPMQFLSEHDISDLGGTVALVTAASLSLPLNRLLVRTYGAAIEYQLPPEATLSQLPWATSQAVPVANEGQGEAIAYGPEGYWHVSEGKEPPIWHLLCE